MKRFIIYWLGFTVAAGIAMRIFASKFDATEWRVLFTMLCIGIAVLGWMHLRHHNTRGRAIFSPTILTFLIAGTLFTYARTGINRRWIVRTYETGPEADRAHIEKLRAMIMESGR